MPSNPTELYAEVRPVTRKPRSKARNRNTSPIRLELHGELQPFKRGQQQGVLVQPVDHRGPRPDGVQRPPQVGMRPADLHQRLAERLEQLLHGLDVAPAVRQPDLVDGIDMPVAAGGILDDDLEARDDAASSAGSWLMGQVHCRALGDGGGNATFC